jgi:hypothetical protein
MEAHDRDAESTELGQSAEDRLPEARVARLPCLIVQGLMQYHQPHSTIGCSRYVRLHQRPAALAHVGSAEDNPIIGLTEIR